MEGLHDIRLRLDTSWEGDSMDTSMRLEEAEEEEEAGDFVGVLNAGELFLLLLPEALVDSYSRVPSEGAYDGEIATVAFAS